MDKWDALPFASHSTDTAHWRMKDLAMTLASA